jgi:hypothetical protein
LTGQPLVKRGTALVETGEADGRTVLAIFGFDRIQCRDARRIPDLGMGSAPSGKALDEIVAEERQLPRALPAAATNWPIRADLVNMHLALPSSFRRALP